MRLEGTFKILPISLHQILTTLKFNGKSVILNIKKKLKFKIKKKRKVWRSTSISMTFGCDVGLNLSEYTLVVFEWVCS